MKSVFLQILYAFKRDAVFIGTTFLMLCCAGFSVFLGSNAVIEAQEAKIIYTAGSTRIVLIAGFVIFVSFYVKRMFENHEIEAILSHKISRFKVLLSIFLGFASVLLIMLFPLVLILLLLKCSIANTIFWTISVYFEGLIILCFSLCCCLVINSFVHSVLGIFLLYFVGRTIGNFVPYLTNTFSINFESIVENILKITSIVIPRFDLFGKTSWLIYGDYTYQTFFIYAIQTILFCSIFLLLATIDFRKKKF